jgi:hypothetical protein
MVEPGSGIGRSNGTSSLEPFDRWFRYPAGFSSTTAAALFEDLELERGAIVVDPFAGSGVTGTAARRRQLGYFGIEAHPLIAELAALKVAPAPPGSLASAAAEVVAAAALPRRGDPLASEHELVRKCFSEAVLIQLVLLREALPAAGPWIGHCTWALLGTLRDVASVKVGWPYQLPSAQRVPPFKDPKARFIARAHAMSEDLKTLGSSDSLETVVSGDAQLPETWAPLSERGGAACVSSPPYLNNFDYADATRLELYFLKLADSWATMCNAVRTAMVVATCQQTSVGRNDKARDYLERFPVVSGRIERLTSDLLIERKGRKRGKEYDRVIAPYFHGIGRVLDSMRQRMAEGAPVLFVVGDSAPYGIHVDTPDLIASLAECLGYSRVADTTLRKRGLRWASNTQRHHQPLSERLVHLRVS